MDDKPYIRPSQTIYPQKEPAVAEKDYIKKVKETLYSSGNKADIFKKIQSITLPKNVNPLLALIHGDSYELEASINDWVADGCSLKEAREATAHLKEEINTKLIDYLNDWESKVEYYWNFSFEAEFVLFEGSKSSGLIKDSVLLLKDGLVSINSIEEAVKVGTAWKDDLVKTLSIYRDQKRGYKLGEVSFNYEVNRRNSDWPPVSTVAHGSLYKEDGYRVNSFLEY